MLAYRFALALVLATGCPKQSSPDGTVLTHADLASLRDGQQITRHLASLPAVADDPYACRAFAYTDAGWQQVVDIGETLLVDPTCLPSLHVDAAHCPATAESDPVLAEAAADQINSTIRTLSLTVDVVADSHVGDPSVRAWASLSRQRLTDLSTAIVDELAAPSDGFVLAEVCVD